MLPRRSRAATDLDIYRSDLVNRRENQKKTYIKAANYQNDVLEAGINRLRDDPS